MRLLAMSWREFWNDESGQYGLHFRPAQVWQSGGIPPGVQVGDLLRAKHHAVLRRHLSQSAVYLSPELQARTASSSISPQQVLAFDAAQEVLERGELPLLHPKVASALCESATELDVHVTSRFGSFEASPFSMPKFLAAGYSLLAGASRANAPDAVPKFEDEFHGGSAERSFWQFVTERFPRLAPYLHPQVLLANLIESDREDDRRADFVLALRESNESRGLIIEIHGKNKSQYEQSADLEV